MLNRANLFELRINRAALYDLLQVRAETVTAPSPPRSYTPSLRRCASEGWPPDSVFNRHGAAQVLWGPSTPPDAAAEITSIINALNASVVVLGRRGEIVAVNEAWTKAIDRLGFSAADCGVGSNFLGICNNAVARSTNAERIVFAVRRFETERRGPLCFRYWADVNGSLRQFLLEISAFELGNREYTMLSWRNIQDVVSDEGDADGRLQRQLVIEECERRRIGREIHDSTAQQIVAISLLLARMDQVAENAEIKELISNANSAADEVLKELRSFSYLLHSPQGGDRIGAALEGLVRGYAERTGLEFSFACELDGVHVTKELEVPLFRIAQESLANARRHADASRVDVRLSLNDGEVVLAVQDDGCGFDPAKIDPGVGLSSMRERAAEFGGMLTVYSGDSGTLVLTRLPNP